MASGAQGKYGTGSAPECSIRAAYVAYIYALLGEQTDRVLGGDPRVLSFGLPAVAAVKTARRIVVRVLVQLFEHPLPPGDRAIPGDGVVVLAGDGGGLVGGQSDRGGCPGRAAAAFGVLEACGEDRFGFKPPLSVCAAGPSGGDHVQFLAVWEHGSRPRPSFRPPLLRIHDSDSSSNARTCGARSGGTLGCRPS